MDLSGPWPGLAITVITLLPSLEEILSPPKLGLFFPLPSTKEVVRGRDEELIFLHLLAYLSLKTDGTLGRTNNLVGGTASRNLAAALMLY